MDKLKTYTAAGIIFALITGTISHFVYEWSGNNSLAGLLFPINESTWEHMKLVFFPMLYYSFFMNKKLKSEYPCITSAICAGILSGTALIPIIFYTYSGILGYNTATLNILTFIVSVIIAFYTVYRLTLSCKAEKYEFPLKILVAVTAAAFIVFTYFPPKAGLFKNPLT